MSTLNVTPLPFGLRDVKLRPISTSGNLGAPVDLPNARTLSFSEAEDFEELRGDDGLVAVHGMGAAVDWELESGGLPFEAIQVMYGGEITEDGVSPDLTRSWEKKGHDQRPYFQIEGQAISDSGGDVHAILYRCRCTGELSGEMADGSFWLTGASGRAMPKADTDELYKFVQNESETPIED